MAGKTWEGVGTYLSDHAATGLVALTVCGPLLLLLQYSFPASPILKGKLPQRVTELHDADVPRCLWGVAQVEQEGVEPRQVGRSRGWRVPRCLRDAGGSPSSLWLLAPPVAHSTVHYSQHGYPAGTLGQEVGEAGTQGWG